MKKLRQTTLACVLFSSVGIAAVDGADACPITYKTVISEADTQSSAGARLMTLGAVVRQDRANFHKFSRRDPGDEAESVLSDGDQRVAIERAVNQAFLGTEDQFGEDKSDWMLEEIYQGLQFGTVISVTFWHCETPPRATVEIIGLAKPSDPHPAFDPNAGSDAELDVLPPPPE